MGGKYLILLIWLTGYLCNAQKSNLYAVSLIPDNLKENANAVIRDSRIEVNIPNRHTISVKTFRAVTVLNEYGLSSMAAAETRKVKSIDAEIYDAAGNLIKNIRRKDFKEFSLSEGYEIVDGRAIALEYTPVQYPFTIVYKSEVEDSNTAFMPEWTPARNTLTSVQQATILVKCATALGFKFKEFNTQVPGITRELLPDGVLFTARDMLPVRSEQYSPPLHQIVPRVIFGLDRFHLEGVDGDAATWEDFGDWTYNHMLAGSDNLPEATKDAVKKLVGTETDIAKIASIVYKYVQGKTRYVSIQLGIGGWKPMKAADVDRLGYGDCKALTNYTRCLLSAVGVASYYTIIHAGDRMDLDPDFVSVQGNHIVLAVPDKDRTTWLECTSQTSPFGYQGSSTSNRLALVVTPKGSKLIRTTVHPHESNLQVLTGHYAVDPGGSVAGTVEMVSSGLQFEMRANHEGLSHEARTEAYKNHFGINNLKLKSMQVTADRDLARLRENIALQADKYATEAGGSLIVPVNFFNRITGVPQRYRTRNNPFETGNGFRDEDEVTIDIPQGFAVEALPAVADIRSKFGEYRFEVSALSAQKLRYKRIFAIKGGRYEKSEYEEYRLFREQVARADNSKMVLKKV